MARSYAQRVHGVMDHVRQHLDGDLSLDEVAKVAHFSPYHFHRIFKTVTGETLAAFTRRARLERAVKLMRGSPLRTLSSIATEVGFSTPSEFSRVFRAYFGQSPSSWDRRSRLDGEVGLADVEREATRAMETGLEARIVDRPACGLAYVRVRDPWHGNHLAQGFVLLTGWLDRKGVDWRAEELVGVSWESGVATPLDRLVYDLAITVGPWVQLDVDGDGDVGLHQFPALRAVEVGCAGLPETALAWDYLYSVWLPDSGYEPDEVPALKRFRVMPEVLEAPAWQVDCSIAIRARRP